ncbi:MAG: hypothetical protein E7624_02235 [Ruminococcaceae bacterium]|nr:hypothetical protein [Oscillospiraceae bacterium]
MKNRVLLCLLVLLLALGAVLFVACDEPAPQTPPATGTADPCEGGHSYGEPLVLTSPTCTETGTEQQTCTVCGTQKSNTVPAFGHQMPAEWVVDTAPGCETDGARHKACLRCEKTLASEVIGATGHTAGEWQTDTPATCAQAGSRHTACTSCDAVLSTESIPMTSHKLAGSFETLEAATCTTDGTRVKRCSVCKEIRITQPIPATGHVNTSWIEQTKDGVATDRMEKHCDACNLLLETKCKEELVQTSGGLTATDLSYYRRIVYPASASAAFAARVGAFATVLYEMTGNPITAVPDTEAPVAYEILVGRVNRAETDTALADVTGHGYTVQYLNNKIVIVGTTDLVALMGLCYFEDTYMQGTQTALTLPKKAISDRYLTVTVAKGKEIYYTPLHQKDLDTDATYNSNKDPETEYGAVAYGSGKDCAVDAAYLIRDALLQITGASTLSIGTDADTQKAGELQIGCVNRASAQGLLAAMDGGEYAIAVRDGQLVLTAHSVAALRLAAPLLAGYLADAVYTGGDGVKSILLPVNLTFVEKANKNWHTDFEKPDGLTLTSAEDAGDSSLQYYYAGEGVDRTDFEAYCQKLLAAGYTLVTQSEAEDSVFATFLAADGVHTLHVSYHAYTHAEGSGFSTAVPSLRVVSATLHDVYGYMPLPGAYYRTAYSGSDTTRYTFYNRVGQSVVSKTFFTTTYKNQLTKATYGYRIIFESSVGEHPFYIAYNETTGASIRVEYGAKDTFTYSVNGESIEVESEYVAAYYTARGVIHLPTEKLLQKEQSYVKKTDASITSVVLKDVGTGYIITLEDGRFVILDGGTAKTNTPERLWAILCDLHEKIHGEIPTEEHPVQIAAWYISHSHSDHMNAFWDFANFYGGGNGALSKTGGKALVKVEYLLANESESAPLYNTGGPSLVLRQEMRKIHNYFKHGFTFIKVHTGQKLYFANLELQIMYTHEDLYPCRVVTFNDISNIVRLTFTPTGTDGAKGEPVSMIFTGDAYLNSARFLCATYGSALKSDMVTLSHHGGPGTEKRMYDLIAPDVLWWPHVKNSVYTSYLKNSSKGDYIKNNQHFYYEVDQHVFYDIQSVDYVYISDDYNITLYLRYDGPDYDDLYATSFVFEKDASGTVTDVTVKAATVSYYTLSRTPSTVQKLAIRTAKPIAVKKEG